MEQDIVFDFESQLGEGPQPGDDRVLSADMVPTGEFGQQPGNYRKNFKKTVCRYWIKGMCMRGDQCGFLHEMIPERMPDCPDYKDKGVCNDPDCPFKHDIGSVLECNMYALGFCIYGPQCRYKHTRKPGPPPDPSEVEAAKPKMFRDINRVVNSVNKDVVAEQTANKRQRIMDKAHATSARPALPAPQRPRPPSGPPPGAPAGGFVGATRPAGRSNTGGRFGSSRGGFAGRASQPRPPQPRPPQAAPPPSNASAAVDAAGYGF